MQKTVASQQCKRGTVQFSFADQVLKSFFYVLSNLPNRTYFITLEWAQQPPWSQPDFAIKLEDTPFAVRHMSIKTRCRSCGRARCRRWCIVFNKRRVLCKARQRFLSRGSICILITIGTRHCEDAGCRTSAANGWPLTMSDSNWHKNLTPSLGQNEQQVLLYFLLETEKQRWWKR